MIPVQKRATADAAAARPSTDSPRSSTGRRSTRGSRPTQSWLRFRSTAWASRSAKVVVRVRAARSVSGITDRRLLPLSDGRENGLPLERKHPQLRWRAAQKRQRGRGIVVVVPVEGPDCATSKRLARDRPVRRRGGHNRPGGTAPTQPDLAPSLPSGIRRWPQLADQSKLLESGLELRSG